MGWIFFLYPLMELWSLIELGAQTTAATAVLWVLVAGLVGLGAIRFAGTQVLTRLQAAQREGALQQHLLAGDMALAFAGLLLMVPGLISDALAVLIMIPPLRRCWPSSWVCGESAPAHNSLTVLTRLRRMSMPDLRVTMG